jgi:hypothetical protein
MTRRIALALPLSLLLALSAAPAAAQSDADRATARDLGREGEAALGRKDYKTAVDRFRRADKMVHAPTLELGLARALAGEGKLIDSQETYNRIIREGVPAGAPDVFKKAVDAAKQEVDAVSARVAGATITVQGDGGADVPGVAVTIDDQPINSASLGVRRPVDPGDHVVKATADGFQPGEARFTVGESGSQSVQITLHKAAAPAAPAAAAPAAAQAPVDTPPDTGAPKRSILPWIAFGVGGAGLITGAITGGLTLGQHSQIASDCGGGSSCPTSEQSKIDSFHTMAMVSNVSFIVGGLGVAAGVVLLIVHPYDAPPSAPATGLHVTPAIGPGSVGAIGTF